MICRAEARDSDGGCRQRARGGRARGIVAWIETLAVLFRSPSSSILAIEIPDISEDKPRDNQ